MKKEYIVYVIIITITLIGAIFLANKYMGGFIFGNIEMQNSNIKSSNTHIIENNINDEKQLSVETIYTFNDKNICVSQRMKYEFSSNEEAKKEYDLWNEQKNLKNISISENIVSFNTDVNIGTAKDSIISNLEKSSSKYEIY